MSNKEVQTEEVQIVKTSNKIEAVTVNPFCGDDLKWPQFLKEYNLAIHNNNELKDFEKLWFFKSYAHKILSWTFMEDVLRNEDEEDYEKVWNVFRNYFENKFIEFRMIRVKTCIESIKHLRSTFPFKLTPAQKKELRDKIILTVDPLITSIETDGDLKLREERFCALINLFQFEGKYTDFRDKIKSSKTEQASPWVLFKEVLENYTNG